MLSKEQTLPLFLQALGYFTSPKQYRQFKCLYIPILTKAVIALLIWLGKSSHALTILCRSRGRSSMLCVVFVGVFLCVFCKPLLLSLLRLIVDGLLNRRTGNAAVFPSSLHNFLSSHRQTVHCLTVTPSHRNTVKPPHSEAISSSFR